MARKTRKSRTRKGYRITARMLRHLDMLVKRNRITETKRLEIIKGAENTHNFMFELL